MQSGTTSSEIHHGRIGTGAGFPPELPGFSCYSSHCLILVYTRTRNYAIALTKQYWRYSELPGPVLVWCQNEDSFNLHVGPLKSGIPWYGISSDCRTAISCHRRQVPMIRRCLFTSVNRGTECIQRGYRSFTLHFIRYLPLNINSQRPETCIFVMSSFDACSIYVLVPIP